MRASVAMAILVCGLALGGCGSSAPASFTVRGTVIVSGQLLVAQAQWVADTTSGHCAASPPEQLTVENSSHKVLASTQLALGSLTSSGACRVRFTLAGVPGGSSQYGFTIGNAGTVWLPASQAPHASLTLGPAGG